MSLFHITLRARFLPSHPKYWDLQFAYLHVWLYADDEDSAMRAAGNCLEAFSLELVGDRAQVRVCSPGMSHRSEIFEGGRLDAQRLGFSWRMIACKTGADEEDFETQWEDGKEEPD